LAALLRPSNFNKTAHHSLAIIDDYVSEANADSILKSTVEKVKPYLFKMIQERLEEEMARCLDAV